MPWSKKKMWLWILIPTGTVIAAGVGLGVGLGLKLKNNDKSITIDVDNKKMIFWQNINVKNWWDCKYSDELFYRYFSDKNKIGKYRILTSGNLKLITFFNKYGEN